MSGTPGFHSRFPRRAFFNFFFFLGSSYTSDFKIGTPVATLPGAWCYRFGVGMVGAASVYSDWVR